jgi:HrpA-like RNA helicase
VIRDGEKFLSSFEAFLIDEAHELRKTTLIILAILKNLLLANPDKYKLIVTSATLDTNVFMKGFEFLQPKLIEARVPTFDVTDFYTLFPDLDSTLTENTVAHIRAIFEVRIKLSAYQEEPIPEFQSPEYTSLPSFD